MMERTLLLLTAVLLAGAVNSQGPEGQACGQDGECIPQGKCLPAREGVETETCSSNGTTPMVCCLPANRTTSATALHLTASSQCPPLPVEAVKVNKTGQIAWDKCIDLAEFVFPCIHTSFLINSPRIRQKTCKHPSTSLILGGLPPTVEEFPHMAVLGYGDQPNIQWACSGTLVSEQWVLTAGHCTFSRDTGNVRYAMLGIDRVDSTINPENLYTITKAMKHPDFISISVYNDIALLQLDRTVTFTSFIRPACLHTGQPINDKKAVATGWDVSKIWGKNTNTLLKMTLNTFSHTECAEKNPPTRKMKDGIRNATQLCAGLQSNTMDCQGDTGGPLQLYNDDNVYCTHLVIGVTSYGQTCGTMNRLSIYTRVSAFIPWIESVVWP